jgi:predicted nucleotidyltransferase
MPTALELSREDWQPYIEGVLRRAVPVEKQAVEERVCQALLEKVCAAADMLRQEFGVRRVVLFGSLARGEWLAVESDVDLAVEGLLPEQYWVAWQKVEELISEVPVDFVEMETARPSLRRAILRQGVEV